LAQNPVYKKYTVDDGLPSNEIYQITQDSKGYIWLATSKGASRFDGRRFENFTLESGLPDNEVLQVVEDKYHRIWFKSFTGPMSYYDGAIHNSANTPFLKQLEFKHYPVAFTPLYNGDVLMSNFGKNTLLLRDTTVSIYDSVNCTYIFEEKDSSVLQTGYNFVIENGKLLNNLLLNGDGPRRFIASYSKQQDILIAVNDQGMFALHRHKLTAVKNQNLICTRTARLIAADREGYFWMTDFQSLYRFKIEADSVLTDIRKYFEETVVNNVFQDNDNNLWFATKGEGLIMVPSINIRLFNKISGLKDNNVTTAKRINNEIICGTLNGYLQTIDDKDKVGTPVKPDGMPVKKILADKSTGAFVLTQLGLFYRDPTGIKMLCKYANSFKSMTIGSQGEIIVGAEKLLTRYYHGKITLKRLGEGDFRVYSLCERVAGELWIGTEKGLYILRNDSLIPFHAELKPFRGWINDISKTSDGKMLITTRDSGVAIITEGKIDFITTKDGLQSNSCTSLYYDHLSAKIFLGLNKGLSVISFTKGSKVVIKNYSPASGLLCGSIFSISEKQSEILLGTDKGLLIFNEQDLNTAVESIKVFITNFEINNVNVNLKPDYNLNFNENDFRIIYDGISFRDPQSLEFRYKLMPNDTGWNITKTRTIVYNNLSPGSYKFAVQARSGNGNWFYENSSLCFTIRQPFWATWWFRLLVLSAGAAIVYGIYKYQLKKKVEQRLAILADRARISSEMHDDLGSGLSKISMLSDMISRDSSGKDMKPHLENISRSSREMLEKMGDIIWSMNEKNDQLANLIAYTRKYAMEFFEATIIHCIVIIPEFIPPVEIDGKSRRNVILVVKEALNNVLKHSGSNTVTLEFDIAPHSFSITIKDNGVGIDPLKISAFGNGLLNMDKRMKDVGGTFYIKNQEGTSLQISIPIKT
jgi:ligand-binding sensor domain-containing protein/two-component sensor histidine kinase